MLEITKLSGQDSGRHITYSAAKLAVAQRPIQQVLDDSHLPGATEDSDAHFDRADKHRALNRFPDLTF
ncbi:hypothetical protein [Rhodococcus sp. ABRD24]|uniref:hypothetical protein n=1 Tax=Rhodococcus sp. ABRD24 TaxID=2507582 RepID=UPI001F616BED|nr:hypothetical protein [Rhodococcus sp. ABRD24]